MKWLIALLTAATGTLHLLVGLNVIGGNPSAPQTNMMLVLNGAGYLVLMVLFLATSGSRRNTIRWILLAYALITLVGYFVLGGTFSNTVALLIKAIELLLIILLAFYKEPVPVAAPVAAASRTAGTIATGAGAAAATVGAGAAAVAATAADKVDDAADATGAAVAGMADRAGDAIDATGDAVADAADAVADAAGDAVDAVADALDVSEPTPEELRAELEEYLRSFGPSSEFRKDIEYIEGIGAAYGQKLRGAGVNTVMDLMVNGATRTGRKNLSAASGISASQILTWVNHVDLYRIKGVAEEYADLLEQTGVDTVVELAHRNPANLHKRMIDINEEKKLVRRTPHMSEVESWVEQAKGLKRLIHY